MAMNPPPAAYPPDVTGRQPGTPAPSDQGETRACPVCQGSGEVPATMGREEMLQALDTNMPSPENPEQGEMSNNPPMSEISAAKPFAIPNRPALTADQNKEVDRLSKHARSRMSKRNFGY